MADEPQGQRDEHAQREQRARYLTYTERFLMSAVQRGELHPRSYELMLGRINQGLRELGFGPLPSGVAPPPTAPAEPAAGPAPRTYPDRPAVRPRPTERAEPLSGRQLGMTWLLYLGAFFLFLAAVTFTAFAWQDFSDVLKFFIIAMYTVGLFGVSALARRFGLPQAEATFFWLGTATVPISVGAFVAFVLGVPLESTLDADEWWRPRWLALELLGTGLIFLGLERWKKNLGLRVVGLAAIGLAPLAQLMTVGQLAPVAAAGVSLAYTIASGLVPKGRWRDATKWTALAIGGVAFVIAAVSGADRFFEEMEIVHTAGQPADTDASAVLAFAMLTIAAYIARRWKWWETRLPEAALAGITATGLATAFGFGDMGDAGRLLYLAALVVPAAYAAFGRLWETLVSAAPPLAAILLLSQPETLVRVVAPALEADRAILAGDALAASAITIVGGLVVWALWKDTEGDRRLTLQIGTLAGVFALAAWLAVVPMPLPWSSVALTVIGCGLLLAAALTDPRAWGPAAGVALALALLGMVGYVAQVGITVATSATAVADPPIEPAWWLAAYFALTAATVLALRYVVEWGRRLSLIFLSLAWLSTLFGGIALGRDEFVPLAIAAVLAYLTSFVYEADFYRPAGTLFASFAVLAYADTLVDDMDLGIVFWLLTPAFVQTAFVWWDSKEPLRQVARSLSLFVIPALVLIAGAATTYGDDVTVFFYVILLGSAFAVVGFTKRIIGFAVVGLVGVLFATFEFVAPYISYIPAWIAFGIVGIVLLAAYFVWLRLRGRAIAEHLPVTGWR